MNELVVKQFGSVGALQTYAAAMRGAVAGIGAGLDGKDILKVNPDEGYWLFGEAQTEVRDNDLWAVNPLSCRHGYIAFAENAVALDLDEQPAEILEDIRTPLPEYEDLPRLKEVKFRNEKKPREPDWQFQLALDFRCIEGDNEGAEVAYKPTSVGGLRMQRKLFEEMSRRIADGNEFCVPLISLYVSEYRSKTFNKRVFNPEFEIVEWLSLAEAVGAPATHTGEGEIAANGHPVDTQQVTHDRDQVEPEYDENGYLVADENGDVAGDYQEDVAPEPEPQPVRGRQRAAARPQTDEEFRARGRAATEGSQDETNTTPRGVAAAVPRGRTAARQPVEDATPQPITARRGSGRPARADSQPVEQPRSRGEARRGAARSAPEVDDASSPEGRNSRPATGRAGPRPRR